MRIRRAALIVTSFCSAAAVAAVVLPSSTPAANVHQESPTAWTNPTTPHPASLDSGLTVYAQQLAVFATALTAYQDNVAAAAFQAAEAPPKSATTSVVANTGSSARASTPVSTAGGSAGDIPPVGDPAVWSCIITHESNWNPGAVNSSSGAGGLFQFLPSTWQHYAPGLPEDASVAEQVSVATAAYDDSYWHPWVGDGCTPIG